MCNRSLDCFSVYVVPACLDVKRHAYLLDVGRLDSQEAK